MECLRICVVTLTLYGLSTANEAPTLANSKTWIITGDATTGGRSLTVQLYGRDKEGDLFAFRINTLPSSLVIRNTTLSPVGKLTFHSICARCTGEEKFTIMLNDTNGNSRTVQMMVKLKDRVGPLEIKEETAADILTDQKGLLKWHVYLIILGTIIAVGVLTCIVMCFCCTFTTDIYDAPLKRPNKIIDKPAAAKSDSDPVMNPFAIPRRQSLIVREAVRNGAADGVPYYGTTRQSVWIPNVPDSDPADRSPSPKRFSTIEESDRRATIAPANLQRRDTGLPNAKLGRRLTDADLTRSKPLLSRLSWHDISTAK